MILIEEGAIPAAALPVAQLRSHLRLGTGFAEDSLQDGLLEGFLRAAIAAIEARTSKVLLARDFRWSLNRWRSPAAQALPVAPVTVIHEVRLIDRAGAADVVDPSTWRLEGDAHLPRLRAVTGLLPSIPAGGTAEVLFNAGYGPGWADVPADLAQAVMILAAHYYEHRDETRLSSGCMPFGVTALTERYRPVRLGAGGGQ